MLKINQLLKWADEPEDKPVVERVLWVDLTKTDVVTIEVTYRLAKPIYRKLTDLTAAIDAKLLHVLETDKYAPRSFSESELKKMNEKYKKERDKRYKIIEPFTHGENSIQIFDPHRRAAMVAKRAAETGVSEMSLYKYLRRWWQAGQILNALLPLYTNGGRRSDGKPKKIGQKKRGRKSTITTNDPGKVTGVNVDANWLKIIIDGGDKYWVYRAARNWHKAYRQTLRFECPKATITVSGKEKTVLLNPNKGEVFTKGQFRYHYLKHLRENASNLMRAIIRGVGERKYNLRHRPLKGNAKDQALYPGALYQIDATLADVNLISTLNPNDIIGRPWVYAIIDAFSRMIVGLAVRLEGEGWLGLRLALENVVTDKVAFCARYGFNITKEIWPTCHLGDEITGDRGPLSAKQAANIPEALRTRVSLCAPYRADWKGIIEQLFNRLNVLVFRGLPGAVPERRERGDKDTRLDAALNIHDLTEAIIAAALYYNTRREMSWYPLDRDMIADGVRPIPLHLYYWGIENRGGTPIEQNAEDVRVALLPERKASITELGIVCGAQDQIYTCEALEKEGWDFLAREYGREPIYVGHDPRTTDLIYYPPGGGRPRVPCSLKDPESPYRGKDWSEVEEHVRREKVRKAESAPDQLQALSELDEDLDLIAARAKKNRREAAHSFPNRSKTARRRDIPANRDTEKEAMRRAEAVEIRAAAGLLAAANEQSEDEPGDVPVPIPQPDNVRELRRRMMKNG
ncbi:MAG TPA: transposase family protein [Pyrinomonadaceae bacterium]|nr:transposase family protein [Pyrinomonadaceae bacterium]